MDHLANERPAGAASRRPRADRDAALRALVESRGFGQVVMAVIIVNAITLGLETSERAMAAAGPLLLAIDRAALVFFTMELTLRLWAYRLAFFRGGWNLFDLAVVAVSWAPAAGAVLGLVFYVSAVMATQLFSATFPQWFGSVGASLFSLFQVMTLESWSMGIARPVMEVHPWAWMFFVPFVVVTSFTVLNLFIALIVNSMQTVQADEQQRSMHAEEIAHDEREAIIEMMEELRREIRELKDPPPAPRLML